ncbi:MAG: AMP-binding protein [Actinomycetota bacterium]|nr:AMP-binding protein [Actinomycetota bacterium]
MTATETTAAHLLTGGSEPTMRALFSATLERFGGRPAVISGDNTLTYADLAAAADRLAGALAALGVGPGTPVALLLSNGAPYVVADLAIIRLGAAKVPLNDMLSATEIGHILRDSGAVVALSGPRMLAAGLAADAPELRTIVTLEPPAGAADDERLVAWDDLLADAPAHVAPGDVSPADVGLIMYTGGTTGMPKGVVHTQQNLVLNLLSHIIEMGLADDERLLLMSPLPHSAGFLLQAGLVRGAVNFVEPAFDPDLVLDRIERDRVTYTFMVPTMIYRVLDRAVDRSAAAPLDLSALRTILYGAAPITQERLTQGLELLGPVFMQLYAQSEAPNFITRLRRDDHRNDPDHVHRLTSCGQPVAMAEVRVLDDNGDEVPRGEVGEICARTPYTMIGYRGLPEVTAETLVDGWLHTGDVGRMDDEGYVYLLDRKKDMIITGGMNVYCSEVENVLATYDGVRQVAVAGIDHPDWGEAVVAFVVATEPGAIDEATVLARCRDDLSAYKRPKAVRIVDALPVTAYGKFDKKALRATWPGW